MNNVTLLKNELGIISELISDAPLFGNIVPVNFLNDDSSVRVVIRNAFERICNAWKEAIFSEAPDYSLRRYFHYHLEGIREISDTLSDVIPQTTFLKLLNEELISLINFQQKFSGEFFNQEAIAPKVYHFKVVERLGDAVLLLQEDLKKAFIDSQLKDCLSSYFETIMLPDERKGYTFKSLFYLERLVLELHAMNLAKRGDGANKILVDKLMELNFNQIAFFLYRQQQTRSRFTDIEPIEKLKTLKEENTSLQLLPQTALICDSNWPTISVMFSGWLNEEIIAAEKILEQEANYRQEKLPLNLSVAHLACFLKVFFEENLFKNPNLREIFKFMSRNFQTKRQPVISADSLSKELYSINQVTAAVVRNMLLKMVARINHDFFPLLAVISAATAVSAGIH